MTNLETESRQTKPKRTRSSELQPNSQEAPAIPLLTYLSLGWGVQSFTIAAMTALGLLPPIDMAIHADTSHELAATYQHAEKWTPWLEAKGLKVVTVSAPEEVLDITAANRSGVFIPAYTVSHATGKPGQLSRQCTDRWKIRPIHNHLKTIVGKRPRPGAVRAILGISLDEWHRTRTSSVKYIENEYPLVDLRITRGDCITWLAAQGLDIPPKSACVFCPYHSTSFWKTIKKAAGPDWAKAASIDESLRARRPGHNAYIHRAALPLPSAVRIPEDLGAEQLEMDIPCDAATCFV